MQFDTKKKKKRMETLRIHVHTHTFIHILLLMNRNFLKRTKLLFYQKPHLKMELYEKQF